MTARALNGGEPRADQPHGLLVRVDGQLLSEGAARDLWGRFSAHMEAHRGDLAGFAKKEGFSSIRPALEQGVAILIASHTDSQVAYRNVSAEPPPRVQGKRSSGGSKRVHAGGSPRAKKR